MIEEIKVIITSWHSKQYMGALMKHPYILHIAPGRTKAQAFKNMAKELRKLADDCDQEAKNSKEK